jgi:hypothetical protein
MPPSGFTVVNAVIQPIMRSDNRPFNLQQIVPMWGNVVGIDLKGNAKHESGGTMMFDVVAWQGNEQVLILELCAVTTLDLIHAAPQPLDQTLIKAILQSVFRGLEACHSAGSYCS